MSYLLVAILFLLFLHAANISERHAIERRTDRLTSRQPVSINEWTQEFPAEDPEKLVELLSVIGTGLTVPSEYLLPTDSFDHELNIKDRFACLVAEDDSKDSIADIFEEKYNKRPSCDWTDLREVVEDNLSLLQNAG